MAHEKILRQQKEREVQSNLDLLDRQGQEMDLLKALLAKLQKYERDFDQKHIPTEQNKQNKEVVYIENSNSGLLKRQNPFGQLLQYEKKSMIRF